MTDKMRLTEAQRSSRAQLAEMRRADRDIDAAVRAGDSHMKKHGRHTWNADDKEAAWIEHDRITALEDKL